MSGVPVRWLLITFGVSVAACGGSALERWFHATGPLATPTGEGRFEGQGIVVVVHEVWGAERAAWLRQAAGLSFDPFDVARDGEPVFRTFAFELENRSSGSLGFTPSLSQLTFGASRRYPLGFSELYTFLVTATGDDRLVTRLEPILAETPGVVAEGKRVSRLLVFNRLPPRLGKVALDLAGFRTVDGEVAVHLEFRRSRLGR